MILNKKFFESDCNNDQSITISQIDEIMEFIDANTMNTALFWVFLSIR